HRPAGAFRRRDDRAVSTAGTITRSQQQTNSAHMINRRSVPQTFCSDRLERKLTTSGFQGIGGNKQELPMRAILAAALASAVLYSIPAGAVEYCDKSCIGPACVKNCVREPDVTLGRRDRDRDVIIEERTRRSREPGVEIRGPRRPGVEIDVR